MRYLGVDPGGKKIGFAVGDDVTGVVTPLEVARTDGVPASARLIVEAAERVGADRVVIGVPVGVDGTPGPAARRTELLVDAVESRGLVVVVQPEYLSTNEARRRARAAGRPTARPVDDIAAQVILEEYLAVLGSVSQVEG